MGFHRQVTSNTTLSGRRWDSTDKSHQSTTCPAEGGVPRTNCTAGTTEIRKSGCRIAQNLSEETSEAMWRAPSDSENREMMRGISKKLRRSRRKVEKLEITLLSLNAGRKSQARKRGEDTRQRSRTKKLGIYARQESRTREPEEKAR